MEQSLGDWEYLIANINLQLAFMDTIPRTRLSLARQAIADLATDWALVVSAANAAPLSIVNEVDTLAPVSAGFQYVETNQNRYEGRFTFEVPRGGIVLECHQECACDPNSCINSVAQKPRNIPMEIFKTTERSWGVRSPVPISKGAVLGVVTGPRRTAERLKDSTYLWDLDTVQRGYEQFTMDCTQKGNWTRFLNHSCNPNLDTYAVSWDPLLKPTQHQIAVVARVDIDADVELTLDYHPQTVLSDKDAMTRPCLCGSNDCRGWF
ncbi:SET domain-containing protein [Dendrothele bispora CBS 962.96]|uniref:SET domain-containing protein n=1 Tax=Dendrothele bispora (strain CBS 962.96) TaxID=1314807 RepID=A0A4S8M4V5_DENBC|nr:SET domain-containing protein [Dendrothele bispora CBS 962.96]